MDEFRVSVVIPAYKCAATITRAIDSLLAQTRRPEEIIVVDDGSPDDIAGVLKPYGDAVRIYRKLNGGASSARNVGLDASTGNIIAFLDSDDTWEPDKLRMQLEVLREHPDVGLVSSRYMNKTPVGEIETYPSIDGFAWNQVLRPMGEEAFRIAMAVWTGVVMFRREVLGSERFDTSLTTAEDRDLWVRLVSRTPVYFIERLTATAYERPGSLSRADIDLDCRCMLRVIQKHAHMLGIRGVRRWETRVYRRWAADHLGRHHPERAIRPAARRLMYQPASAEAWWVLWKSAMLSLHVSGETVAPQRAAG